MATTDYRIRDYRLCTQYGCHLLRDLAAYFAIGARHMEIEVIEQPHLARQGENREPFTRRCGFHMQ